MRFFQELSTLLIELTYNFYTEVKGTAHFLLKAEANRRRSKEEIIAAKKEIEDIKKGGEIFKKLILELKAENTNLAQQLRESV